MVVWVSSPNLPGGSTMPDAFAAFGLGFLICVPILSLVFVGGALMYD